MAYFWVRHEEGLGMGDPKMLAMIGAFLGWKLALLTLMMASLAGSGLGVGLIATGRGSLKYDAAVRLLPRDRRGGSGHLRFGDPRLVCEIAMTVPRPFVTCPGMLAYGLVRGIPFSTLEQVSFSATPAESTDRRFCYPKLHEPRVIVEIVR